jgi:hypothetical protein
MFRRKPLARSPHPDARIEAELQRIISLRSSLARQEEEAAHATAEAVRADRHAGRVESHGVPVSHRYAQRAQELRAIAAQAEAEIISIHAEIAKRIAALSDDDLLWLDTRTHPQKP